MADSAYILHWDASFPLKIALGNWGSKTNLKHGSLSPPKSNTERHQDQSAVLAGLVIVIDRQTNEDAPFVIIGRICVCSTAMRPNNI